MEQDINPKTSEPNSQNTNGQKSLFFGQPHSKTFQLLVVILFILALCVGSFALGINIGQRKAKFTCDWAKNYPQNFMMPKNKGFSMPPQPNNKQMFNAHGVTGEIISINKDELILKDLDGNEQTIILNNNPSIKYGFEPSNNLQTGQQIVVLGTPDEQGNIIAKIIRVIK